MNAPERIFLADVQASADIRNVAIDQVGIKGMRFPVSIRGAQGVQSTVSEVALTVGLAPHVKGTHMSRFIEVMEAWREPLCGRTLGMLLDAMLARLDAQTGRIDFTFPYFIRKTAPVSGVSSLLDYSARLCVEGRPGAADVTLGLTAPVTSLCPCSKEISEYGAHNQRSHVTIEARMHAGEAIDLEALARIAEDAASCEVYGLLKRPDEKYVTERAYDNPKFVEDLVRDLAIALDAHPAILSYTVEAENFESIHNHSAFARIARSN